MKIQKQSPFFRPALASISVATLIMAPAHAATVAIVNGGFDTGTDGSATILGWTDSNPGSPGFWLANDNSPGSTPDPTEDQSGTGLYLSANRLTGGAGSQPSSSTLSQTVALDPTNLALVAGGAASLELDFYYFDTDQNDVGSVTVAFLDGSLATIGSITTGTLPGIAPNGTDYDPVNTPWTLVDLDGAVPAATTSLRIDISTGPRASGSATNVHFDSFSAQIVPEPGAALLGLIGLAATLRRRRA